MEKGGPGGVRMPVRPPKAIPPNQTPGRVNSTEPEAKISELEEKNFKLKLKENFSETENSIKNIKEPNRNAYALGIATNIRNGTK